MTLEEIHVKGEALRNLIMVHTYPLAVKFCKSDAEFPEKTRRPTDFKGRRWAMCQAWAVSRTVGWTVGLTPKESICPPGNILFGWAEPEEEQNLEDAWLEMGIAETADGVKRFLREHCRLEKGEYMGVVFSPLEWTRVVPDLVMVYCNPAQAGMLVGAHLYKEGKSIHSTFRSSAGCASALIGTLRAGGPQIVLPCMGERGLAKSQDSELIFTFPGEMLEDLINGLEGTRKHGYNRIPIVPYLLYEPDLIPPYLKLEKKLRIIE